MKEVLTITIVVFCFIIPANAQSIRGIVKDVSSGEELVGATILVKGQPHKGYITGLNGSFVINDVKTYPVTLTFSYMGYKSLDVEISKLPASPCIVKLEQSHLIIGDVVVQGTRVKNTEISARITEKNSINVVNVVSGKAIELSPDMTVGNVVSRVSGITVERNSSGEGQYALLRGMDKRYNYTLVNSIKIPSPDNKNRFLPLDIFPSELLDRLEVTKALTADMEGDGIGGAVNMVMKDAPTSTQFTVNLSTGYNFILLNRNFQSFDYSAIDKKSPLEKYGVGYESSVKMRDFTSTNLHLKSGQARPNIAGGFSWGKRFFRERLGIMLAGSYSDALRGTTSDIYTTTVDVDEGAQVINNRHFSTRQTRLGTHVKLDYSITPAHKIVLYNAYMDFGTAQVRDSYSAKNHTVRMRYNHQSIFNTTLKGFHDLLGKTLKLDWSLNYGSASNETPDNVTFTTIIRDVEFIAPDLGATRRWEHNSDDDKAAYGNLLFTRKLGRSTLDLSGGGMFRDKARKSFFDIYSFMPFDAEKENTQNEQIKGVDWNNYDEVKFKFKGVDPLNPLNNSATERIWAGYVAAKLSTNRLQLIGGLRYEHTNQGYDLIYESPVAKKSSQQIYEDILPSMHLKYKIYANTNLRLSYYKAINRPSFFEILPYQMVFDDYTERGNPDLKHAVAQNVDLRYEIFPRPSEQFMVGVFYKNIKDPIEYGFIQDGSAVYYKPINNGTAHNYGLEVDVIKYFHWFGVKANYTFTRSQMTTSKKLFIPESDDPDRNTTVTLVDQTRPLFGQAAHVVNVSALLHSPEKGWDAQIAFSYTGPRLVVVSQWLNDDTWQAGFIQMDASLEKRFRSGITIFGKASNLLSSPMTQYVKINRINEKSDPLLATHNGGILDRKERYGQNITIGIKYKY